MPTTSGTPPDPAEILAALRADIGSATPWRHLEVTQADAARFRAAIDPAARSEGPASAISEPPPTFFSPDPIILSQSLGWVRHRPFPNTLDGGTRWEWFSPLRVGDVVRLRAEVVDVKEKMGSSRTGRMFLTELLVSCAALDGSIIARCSGTSISYEGPNS
jgi:hypothetical protein